MTGEIKIRIERVLLQLVVLLIEVAEKANIFG